MKCLLTIFVTSSITVMERALLNIWVTLHLVLVYAIARNHVFKFVLFFHVLCVEILKISGDVLSSCMFRCSTWTKAMKICMFFEIGLQISYL